MPVDIFTKDDFEAALPIHNQTGEELWKYTGLEDGEHTYIVHPFKFRLYGIKVRSSVHSSGHSAKSGKDSIRSWIVRPDGSPVGSKLGRWTTRMPGWKERLTEVLRGLAGMIQEIKPCPTCNEDVLPFKVKKDGPNKGRLFLKCCNKECSQPYFKWLETVQE